MRRQYDLSQGIRNPYAKRLKKQLTIRLDAETVEYFQGLAREMSLPYLLADVDLGALFGIDVATAAVPKRRRGARG